MSHSAFVWLPDMLVECDPKNYEKPFHFKAVGQKPKVPFGDDFHCEVVSSGVHQHFDPFSNTCPLLAAPLRSLLVQKKNLLEVRVDGSALRFFDQTVTEDKAGQE